MTIGSHLIKSYSRQQKTVALSSAEAELHAMVAASAETIGVVALCRDMGIVMEGEVYADSTAAIGIAQRSGSGRVRHIRVQALWVQEVRSTGRLSYKKVLGSRNPADILTKHVGAELLQIHLKTLGVEARDGRAETAPTLDTVEPWTISWLEEEEVEKTVSFHPKVCVRTIPAVGRGRSTSEAKRKKTSWKGRRSVQGGASDKEDRDLWADAMKSRKSWAEETEEEERRVRSGQLHSGKEEKKE